MTRLTFLVTVVTLVLTGLLFAKEGESQSLETVSVSLSYKNTKLDQILDDLEKQSGFTFTYTPKIGNLGPLSIKVDHQTLLFTLKKLATIGHLSFQQNKMLISVSQPPPPSNPPPPLPPGSIKGRIVEFETSEPLPGATIKILELPNKGTVSSPSGYYTIGNLPPGKYTLQVSFIGFETYSQPNITVPESKEIVIDIKLRASNNLKEVVVKGRQALSKKAVSYTSEKELLTEVRSASAVVSGISNEQIVKSADRNAAEIVKRISGVTVTDERFIVVRGMNARYNQTYLNGNLAPSTELYTHAFAFDLLPSPIIDRILIYKSPTPDLSGDATGGSVKIFTKNAKPVRHFDIGVQLSGRSTTTFKEGNTYKGGRLDWLGFDDGTRTNVTKLVPSFANSYGKTPVSQQQLLNAFSSDLQLGKKNMSPDFQVFVNYFDNFRISKKVRLFNFTMLNYTNENRIQQVYRQTGNLYSSSFGSGITNDANKITDATQSSEKGRVNIMENLLLKLDDRNSIEFKNFFLNEGTKSTSISVSRSNQLPAQDSSQQLRNKDLLESFEQRTLYSGNLTGNHVLDALNKHQLQWNLGYNYYKQNVPDQRGIRFSGQNGSLTSAGSNNSSYRDVFLGMINRTFTTNLEENYQGAVDYNYILNTTLKLKAGAYGFFKNRTVDRRFFQVNRAGLEGVNLAGFQYMDAGIHDNFGQSNPNLIQFRPEDLGKVWSGTYFSNDGKGLAIYDATQPTDGYVADERNIAFYGMGDLHLLNKQLNIVGGLRVEDDRQQLSAAIVQNGAFFPLLIKKPLTILLPSVNATYTLADSTVVIRAGYGKTVNRPEFREISPFSDYDFMNDVVITGNPNLVTAKINNYDLRFEWYPRNHPGETISVGAFYKDLKNPIEQVRNDQSGAVTFMPTNITYWNADNARVYGLEAEVRKSLSFVPGALFRNLSVILNGALIKSQASKAATGNSDQYSFYSGFKDRPLQGQAPYVINTGLFYENPAWGLKSSVSYNVSGTTIYAVSVVSTQNASGNQTNPNGTPAATAFIRPNLIELPRNQLDFSLTKRLFSTLNAKLNIQNLLDQSVRIAEDQNFDNKFTAEKNSGVIQTGAGGVKGPLYKGDNIFRQYKTGRYFLLSFIYAF